MKIGDVEKQLGLPSKTIRYYESCGLLTVRRGDNSYRDYDETAIETLKSIKLMRSFGITVADIRLWCDKVVDIKELLAKRIKELENGSKDNDKLKHLCTELLSGGGTDSEINFGEPVTDGLNEDITVKDNSTCDLILGVDIGTTSISAQVININDGTPVQTYNITHGAEIKSDAYPDAFADDAELLVRRTLNLINSLCATYPGIKAIGVTGQMHGIVCVDADGSILSDLYTWQNEFGLRKKDGITYLDRIYTLCSERSNTGYGLVTYYCLREMGLLPQNTAHIMTVMDLTVMRLCGLSKAVSHATNAASLGFFDIEHSEYKTQTLQKLGIDESVLPSLIPEYRIAGYYNKIPVSAAIGDNQAGVFGSLNSEHQMLVNIGTSGQISVITDSCIGDGDIRPFPGGKYIISGAALCGGRAYSMLADFFRSVLELGGVRMPKTQLYRIMNETALTPLENELSISTQFFGTRNDASLRGRVENLGVENFTAAHFIKGTLTGIVTELYEMFMKFPSEIRARVNETVISGNAVRLNPAMSQTIAEVFGTTPLIPAHTEEAAYGAALYGAISAGLLNETQAKKMIKYF